MKMNVVVALGLASIMAFAAGCGKSKALLAAEDYEKTACACKDTACVTAAAKKFADSAKDMATASSSDAEAITKATAAATECSTKVAMSSIPSMPGMPGKK
jgi:fatty acid-binding protein DegV